MHLFPEEYWSLEASLLPEGEKKPITAKLLDKGGEKFEISSEEQMNQVLAELKGKEFKVCDMKKGERTKKAPLSFLQPVLCNRKASKALNFPISKTMRIPQQLYEGVDIKGQGNSGYHHLSAYGFHFVFRKRRIKAVGVLCFRKLRRGISV